MVREVLPPTGLGLLLFTFILLLDQITNLMKVLVSRGADLDAKDARGNTPVDSALGKAGGNSRGGARIDVHEDTAALLGKLMTQAAAKK